MKTTYKYIWTARKGNEFFSGIQERTYTEMMGIHGTTNLVHLVREWNRMAEHQLTIKRPEGIVINNIANWMDKHYPIFKSEI